LCSACTSPGPFARLADAFRQGLREGGYVEGRNVTIEYRWADSQFARLPELAAELVSKYVEDAMRVTGQQMVLLNASAERDFEPALVSAVQQRVDALLVSANPFFTQRRVQLVALAARHAMPAGYPWREYSDAGGLMSYGPSVAGAYHLIGRYASRILNGEKPADLPVQAPTHYELVINLKTAKALGLDVPATLLAVADEVIE
jgi:putative ABC transport system substrate-binding protein